ncbi:MAG: hypothetical protein ACE15E_02970 [Acidobacteriota bacterium]
MSTCCRQALRRPRRWLGASLVVWALTSITYPFQHIEPGQKGESEPPYFNEKARQMLIEGSYSIIPTKPLGIGAERQLLMDNYVISDSWGCRRTVHQPEKYPDNPIMAGERGVLGPGCQGTILFDPDTRCLRRWNLLWFFRRSEYDLGQVLGYYESEDGIRWVAPKLGLIEFDGNRENNLILGEKGLSYGPPSVIFAPKRVAARGKFIMLYSLGRQKPLPGQTHGLEQRVAWSQDGIHWKDQPENPAIRGRSDTFNQLVYNPDRDVFMMYRFASVNSNQVRIQAYSESKDLVSWTQPEVIIYPDELDSPMFHGLTVTKYQGVYLGLLDMFYQWMLPPFDDLDIPKPKPLQMDLQLAWSRDGREWHRHPERPIFLPNGMAGTYDAGVIMPYAGLIERGDKIYIYYRGDPVVPRIQLLKQTTSASLCLATLRRDGFISLDAPSTGYMLTKPLLCSGGKLHVNARVKPGGFVRVAVRRGDGEKDGDWLTGWNYDQGPEFVNDSTDAVLNWKAQPDFDELKGRPIRLHFWLRQAELYSFWFDGSKKPAGGDR